MNNDVEDVDDIDESHSDEELLYEEDEGPPSKKSFTVKASRPRPTELKQTQPLAPQQMSKKPPSKCLTLKELVTPKKPREAVDPDYVPGKGYYPAPNSRQFASMIYYL